MPSVLRVEKEYRAARIDPLFQAELQWYQRHYGGRPTPLYPARRLSEHAGGPILLKREDLVHGGAHKFNNVMGQALLAKRIGARRILAETGAGQHGVAAAMAGAVLGIPVDVYMGARDMDRQAPNVERMLLMGAKVHAVQSGSATLKDAVNEALRAWSADPEAYYCIGSAVGPHPYPWMVQEFQRVIGDEARRQFPEHGLGDLPAVVVACVGGGSNAIGSFVPFLEDPVRLIGVEAGGQGIETNRHAATLAGGKPGIIHGARTYVLQDDDGQVQEAHSISAGLDYPAIGPEHSHLRDSRWVEYVAVTDEAALAAARLLPKLEGILPALESAHAISHAIELARERPGPIVVTLSGRGDKDLRALGGQ